MPNRSAGLLLYRRGNNGIEVFLVHPGGPFWTKKDAGSWSIPKGEYTEDEDPLAAARREFHEETGFTIDGNFIALGEVKQSSGKIVKAWAVEGDCDPAQLHSNTFQLDWHGNQIDVPEVDRGDWFSPEEAKIKLLKAQIPFLDRIGAYLL